MHVIITGASQGIGRAIAEAFAAEPAARIALVARSADKLAAVAEACRARGAAAEPFPCDVTDETAVGRTAAAIQACWGAPDVLVNNAGLFRPGGLLEVDATAFRQQIEVNLTSAFLVTQAFLPAMLEAGRGHLIYMASVASIRAYAGGAAYCAAKHGLLGLARVVREETRTRGLRVTTLLPGATLTPSWEGTDLPASRFMPPEDIARAVLDVVRLSDRTVVEEMVLRPQEGDV
ncbi:oxidoreductase [Rhodothermaceae bacterium RA]|nr:oxidoreductase [Rhodothermaceae bacterium RA]